MNVAPHCIFVNAKFSRYNVHSIIGRGRKIFYAEEAKCNTRIAFIPISYVVQACKASMHALRLVVFYASF